MAATDSDFITRVSSSRRAPRRSQRRTSMAKIRLSSLAEARRRDAGGESTADLKRGSGGRAPSGGLRSRQRPGCHLFAPTRVGREDAVIAHLMRRSRPRGVARPCNHVIEGPDLTLKVPSQGRCKALQSRRLVVGFQMNPTQGHETAPRGAARGDRRSAHNAGHRRPTRSTAPS